MKQMDLYIIPGCPFCQIVTDYLNDQGIEYKEIDIYADDLARKKLEEVGGKAQCPCLFVDGEPMYESQEILDYLKSRV